MKTSYLLLKTAIVLFLLLPNHNYSQNNDIDVQEMLELVNNLRAEQGAPPVRLNSNLNQAAFDHSNDMAQNNYFDHTGLNGSSFSQRARNAGYEGAPFGENIAAGNSSAMSTFRQWETSSGHLSNMINPQVNEMGIGHAFVNGSDFGHYWTQVFGKGELLSIDNPSEVAASFNVYPNPVKDILHINISNISQKPIDISLYTITGQIVYQQNTIRPEKNIKLLIDHLPKGVYFLNSPNIKTHKIIKQ